jgi:hypothetical protein
MAHRYRDEQRTETGVARGGHHLLGDVGELEQRRHKRIAALAKRDAEAETERRHARARLLAHRRAQVGELCHESALCLDACGAQCLEQRRRRRRVVIVVVVVVIVVVVAGEVSGANGDGTQLT